MRDFRGRDIVEGDEVIFIEPGYRSFTIGTIYKINPKKLIIEYRTMHGSEWVTQRYPNQVLRCKRKEETQ